MPNAKPARHPLLSPAQRALRAEQNDRETDAWFYRLAYRRPYRRGLRRSRWLAWPAGRRVTQ